MKKTYLGIIRDHSGSMYSIREAAAKDFNELIATTKASSDKEGIETIATAYRVSQSR